LFHYTDAQGLIGILQKRCLFATHADFLNDSSECKLLKSIVAPQLADEFRAAEKKYPRLSELKKTPEELVDAVFNTLLATIERTSPFYITSFCLHEEGSKAFEHGLLSQWRGYANGGFAIQFDEDDIDEMRNLEHAKFSHAGLLTEKVHYENHADKVDLTKFVGMAGSMILTIADDKDEVADIFGSKPLYEYMSPFLEIVPFLKNEGFSEEQEYRSVSLAIRPQKRPDIDDRTPKEVHFRVSRTGNLMPYIRLFEQLDRKIKINAVIIGPHANQDNQRKAVSLLMEQAGVSLEVRTSAIPFRDT